MSNTTKPPLHMTPCKKFLEALVITLDNSLKRAQGAYNAHMAKPEGGEGGPIVPPIQSHVEKGKMLALTPVLMVLHEYMGKIEPDKEKEKS